MLDPDFQAQFESLKSMVLESVADMEVEMQTSMAKSFKEMSKSGKNWSSVVFATFEMGFSAPPPFSDTTMTQCVRCSLWCHECRAVDDEELCLACYSRRLEQDCQLVESISEASPETLIKLIRGLRTIVGVSGFEAVQDHVVKTVVSSPDTSAWIAEFSNDAVCNRWPEIAGKLKAHAATETIRCSGSGDCGHHYCIQHLKYKHGASLCNGCCLQVADKVVAQLQLCVPLSTATAVRELVWEVQKASRDNSVRSFMLIRVRQACARRAHASSFEVNVRLNMSKYSPTMCTPVIECRYTTAREVE